MGLTADEKSRIADNLKGKARDSVVGPMLDAGFEPYHTGGGCMAWRRGEPDGSHLLVTYGHDDIDGDPAEKEWGLGRYSDETEDFVQLEVDPGEGTMMTLDETLDAAERFPAVIDGEQLTFATIEEALNYDHSTQAMPGA